MKTQTSHCWSPGLRLLAKFARPLAADKKAEKQAKPYPLNICAVSGEKLDSMGEPFVFVHDGREVMLCCKDCKGDFDKNIAKFMAKIDARPRRSKPIRCGSARCPTKLDSMGEPFVFIHDGQEIKLCCKDCKKDFTKTPAKFMAKLSNAAKKAKK